MGDIFIIIGVIIIMGLIFVFLPQFLYRRALKQVVKIFKQHKAFNVDSARTPNDLGLAQRSFISNMGRLRDYKPRALQLLMDYDVVRKTEDDRVYLVKEKLALYRLED
jgi:hypothetical protein